MNPEGELMFIKNDAYEQYYSIINNAESACPRTMKKKDAMLLRGYIEDHHIIPKSLGGEDRISNKVWLTAAEHFICHKLLTEMTIGTENGKMWSALWRMMNKQSHNQDRGYTISPEEYAEAREQNAKNHSKRMKGELNPFYDKTHSDDTKAIMSAKKKGKSYEEIFGVEKAAEMRARRSIEGLGKPKGKQTTSMCPHCGTIGGIGVMKRWHGDRCQRKITSTE